MKHTIFATTLMFLMALQAQAGTLGSGLEDMIADMDDHEVIKVLVVMQGQPDIRAMDKSLHARDVTLAERHRTVVGALQDAAYNSQAALLRDLDGNKAVGGIIGYVPHWIVNAVVVTGTVEAIREIAARDDVKIVEQNIEPELILPVESKAAPPPAEKGAKGWVTPGITAIQADRVWHELGIDGTGTLVANMDSGVDGTHPALSARWNGNWVAASAAWADIGNVGSPNFPADPVVGHGTHVMGTICGATAFDTVGVAPGARWIATNAIMASLENLDNQVIAGFEWIADPDGDPNTTDDVPDVVQNSWGIGAGYGFLPCDSVWWDVIDNCEAAGVVVVFSAGNEGPAPSTLRNPGNRATSPTNSFSVGSTSYNPPFLISTFSSRGPSNCGGEFEMKPEISAPGEDIYSCVPGGAYAYMNGTSMAGPHVAGVVALMRQAAPNLDVTTIKEILMDTALDRGVEGEDNHYGHGFIDAYAAVTTVIGNVGAVSGLITDSVTGLPLEGVEVRDTRGFTTTSSQADGTYEFTILAGNTDFELTLFGYETQIIPATVPGGGSLDLDAGLAPMAPADVSGTVTGPGGAPLAGATIIAQGTPVDPATSDESGFYTLTLPSSDTANYELLATAPGLAYAVAQTGLAGDRTVDFDLPLPQEDGFETGGLGTFAWTTSGDAAWSVGTAQAYEGLYSAQSGNIDDSGSTTLALDWHVQGDGVITFKVKTDCEIAYDVLEFHVDGLMYETWSGQNDWVSYTAELSAGTHTLEWIYHKDSSTSVGADAVWLDIVELPGTGVELMPSISVDTPALALTLGFGETGSLPLALSNQGEGLLEYTITPFIPSGPEWMAPTPESGTIYPGNSLENDITFDASILGAGVHNGALQIASNDPAVPVSFVGVVLTVTPVSAADGNLPRVATLHGAVPNPFNPMADIKFSVPKQGHVTLRVYDISGRLVRTLVDRPLGPGHHSERWDGRDDAGLGVASGVYYARLVAAQVTSIKPMTLVR